MWECFPERLFDPERTGRRYFARPLDRLHAQLRSLTDHFGTRVERTMSRSHEYDQQDFWLERLRVSSWYPAGIPPQQDHVDEAFVRTDDAIRLVKELMRLEGAGHSTHLLVANPCINIHARAKIQGLSLEKAQRQAHLIGLKDKVFYEAVQNLIWEEADEEERQHLKGVPVLLMSDLDRHPFFKDLFSAVGYLFETNEAFAEAVYDCVPPRFRPRKHHHKTLKELRALGNTASFDQATKAIPYVLYQIAIVLFIGGEKLGHPGEHKYNVATQMAHEQIGSVRRREPHFSDLAIPEVRGKNPYRAVKAGQKEEIPDALTLQLQADVLLSTGERYITDALEALERVFSMQEERTLERHSRSIDGILLHFYLKSQFAKGEIIKNMRDRLRRMSKLSTLMDEALRDLKGVDPGDRSTLFEAKKRQELEELLSGFLEAPFYAERFLFKWSGVETMLSDETEDIDMLPERAGRLLPLEFSREPIDQLTGQPRFIPVPELHFLYSVARRILSPVNSSVIQLNLNALPCDRMLTDCGKGWLVPFDQFKNGLFSSDEALCVGKNDHENLRHAVLMEWGKTEELRWQTLDELFGLIVDTPAEAIYQEWLAQLQGKPSSGQNPSPEAHPAPWSEIKHCLSNPYFNPEFRKFFTERIPAKDCRQ